MTGQEMYKKHINEAVSKSHKYNHVSKFLLPISLLRQETEWPDVLFAEVAEEF